VILKHCTKELFLPVKMGHDIALWTEAVCVERRAFKHRSL